MFNFRTLINIVEKKEVSVPCDDDDILGRGRYRTVCDHPNNKNLVIKYAASNNAGIDSERSRLVNCQEFLIYNKLKSENHPDLEHLVPVVNISNDGKWLTMIKGERFPVTDDVPFKTSLDWIGDVKYQNLVHINGKAMMSDYGTERAVKNLNLPEDLPSALKLIKKIKKGNRG